MGSRAKVVVTGAEGLVAMAVERALRRHQFEVIRVVRGRDLEEPIAEARAVVVLDAARRVAPADYEMVLGAVALAVRDAPVERVVTVTQWTESGEEELFAQVAARAEHDFAGIGVELRPIRFGLLVGVPDAAAPLDDALFETEPNAYVPGGGDQRVRPLLIDDLAGIVVRAVVRPGQGDAVVWAEGRQESSLDVLMTRSAATGQSTTGGSRRLRSAFWGSWVAASARWSASSPPRISCCVPTDRRPTSWGSPRAPYPTSGPPRRSRSGHAVASTRSIG